MRLFVAIKLDSTLETKKILDYLKTNLHADKIKWVDPDNLHLTLKFFGNIPAKKISSINKVLVKIANKTNGFPLQISGVGQFGSRYNPKVLWLNVKNPDPINELGLLILSKLEEIGFETDRQNFVPHVSIGRISEIKSKAFYRKVVEKISDIELIPIYVKSFTLFESKLTSDGPIYKSVKEFRLRSNK
ncbi:MAG: RNA 2',3'-cyclic phosphodiesterase [Bacteroidales bacterium]